MDIQKQHMWKQTTNFSCLINIIDSSDYLIKSCLAGIWRRTMPMPKKRLSRTVIVGVTTPTVCFSCYCHQQCAVQPYQRFAKRRKAIRYRSQSDVKSRSDEIAATETRHQNEFTKPFQSLLNFCWRSVFYFFFYGAENRATTQAHDR